MAEDLLAENPIGSCHSSLTIRLTRIHRVTTAEEIETTRRVMSTLSFRRGHGGTSTGVGTVLKARNPNLNGAVEPEDSLILSGGTPGPHKFRALERAFCPAICSLSLSTKC